MLCSIWWDEARIIRVVFAANRSKLFPATDYHSRTGEYVEELLYVNMSIARVA